VVFRRGHAVAAANRYIGHDRPVFLPEARRDSFAEPPRGQLSSNRERVSNFVVTVLLSRDPARSAAPLACLLKV